jgi:hypothetical protein
MAGNVNEWVGDTFRQMSFDDFEDFNPFRGNQYTNKRMADPAKGTYAKDKYGRPIKDPAKAGKKMKYEDFIAMQQGGQAQPNALNGNGAVANNNAAAAKPTTAVPAGAKNPLAGKPYDPDFRGYADSVNNTLYGTTTLVSDHSKVYKGGSWNDMAFWLNPATRRYLNEDEASAEIGFRCAMTLVGAPEISPGGKPHYSVKKPKDYKPR